MQKIKKWFSNLENQVYSFSLLILTLPLLLIGLCSILTFVITIIVYLIGILAVTAMWRFSKKKKST